MLLSLLSLCWWPISSREKRNFNQIFLFGQFFCQLVVQKDISNTKGIEQIIYMGPYGPKTTKEFKLLMYRIDTIYLPTYWLSVKVLRFLSNSRIVHRIFHREPFIDSQRFWRVVSVKARRPPIFHYFCGLQKCLDVRLKSLIYRCENRS